MQTRIEGKRARFQFDSLAEVARYLEEAPRTWRIEHSRTNAASRTWDLGLGYDRAVTLARDGWLEGAQKAQDALKAFNPASPAPDCRVDFYGHMPHVPRFCAGAPDSMIRHHPKPTIGGGRVLTLYVAINMSAAVNAQYARNFGLGVAQYINQLETDGIRVELYAGVTQTEEYRGTRGWRVAHTWKLKSAEQPLDLAVIAFAIGHPAMYRRLWFAMMERSPATEDYGYYYPRDVEARDIINMPSGAYILNGMREANSCARTPEQALEHIEREIERALGYDMVAAE